MDGTGASMVKQEQADANSGLGLAIEILQPQNRTSRGQPHDGQRALTALQQTSGANDGKQRQHGRPCWFCRARAGLVCAGHACSRGPQL